MQKPLFRGSNATPRNPSLVVMKYAPTVACARVCAANSKVRLPYPVRRRKAAQTLGSMSFASSLAACSVEAKPSARIPFRSSSHTAQCHPVLFGEIVAVICEKDGWIAIYRPSGLREKRKTGRVIAAAFSFSRSRRTPPRSPFVVRAYRLPNHDTRAPGRNNPSPSTWLIRGFVPRPIAGC